MHTHQSKQSTLTKNQVNITPPKEMNKAQITDPKKNKDLRTVKELRIILLK